jgi:hypothetical protein
MNISAESISINLKENNMRYTKSAIGLLTSQYRSVLKKCLLINLGLYALGAIAPTTANAADTITVVTGVGTTAYENVAQSTDGTAISSTIAQMYGVDSAATTTDEVYTKDYIDGKIEQLL